MGQIFSLSFLIGILIWSGAARSEPPVTSPRPLVTSGIYGEGNSLHPGRKWIAVDVHGPEESPVDSAGKRPWRVSLIEYKASGVRGETIAQLACISPTECRSDNYQLVMEPDGSLTINQPRINVRQTYTPDASAPRPTAIEAPTATGVRLWRDQDKRGRPKKTPLVLILDPDAPLTFSRDSVSFPFLDGKPLQGWLSPNINAGFLVLLDDKGGVRNGTQFFGSASSLPNSGRTAKHGFEALAALDVGRTGVIDGRSPLFSRLAVWSDREGKGVCTPGSCRTLPELGIKSLDLNYGVLDENDMSGPYIGLEGTFEFNSGVKGRLVDVFFPETCEESSIERGMETH